MEKVDLILQKFGWKKSLQERIFDFAEIEQKIGFRLPDDYKYYLQNYFGNEGFIGEEYACLWDIDEELLTNNIEYEILLNLKFTLAIESNGAGEFIAINKGNDNSIRIVLCSFIGMTEDEFIEIGNSFTDFLLRLDCGESWFK